MSTDWVQLGIWILLLFQGIGILLQPCASTVYSLGWKAGLSSLVAFASLSVECYHHYTSANISGLQTVLTSIHTSIHTSIQGACAILLSFLALSVPRRPDVYRNGIQVDRQFTSSVLTWVTFSWTGTVLQNAQHISNLTIDDLPEIDHTVRAETLLNTTRQTMPRGTGLALRDLWWWIIRSNSLDPNERVGVVGRSGAGKSSLILTLFRFLDPSAGEIIIDGVDISTLKVAQLRHRLAIIPQYPVIFHGTVVGWHMERSESGDGTSRTSIDTTSSFGDEPGAEYVLMRLVHEKPCSPLDMAVLEDGQNLSQGQRQLLCLARVLIQRPRILVLDEATSAVDKSTDERMQQTLRVVLGRSVTMLVVAHRLSSIIDFDRVLVMDDGRVVEYGSPREVLGMANGVFRGMVDQDSDCKTLRATINSS